MASIDDGGVVQLERRQWLKDLGDRIIDILFALDSTNDTIDLLLKNYRQFRRDLKGCIEELDAEGFDSVEFALEEDQRDVISYQKKVKALHVKLKSTTELVGNSGPLPLPSLVSD